MIPVHMIIKRGINHFLIKTGGFNTADPGLCGYAGIFIIAGYIGPGLTGIRSVLQVTIIRTGPNQFFIQRRFRHGENGTMIFGRCIIDTETTAFFLFLLLLIICGQVR